MGWVGVLFLVASVVYPLFLILIHRIACVPIRNEVVAYALLLPLIFTATLATIGLAFQLIVQSTLITPTFVSSFILVGCGVAHFIRKLTGSFWVSWSPMLFSTTFLAAGLWAKSSGGAVALIMISTPVAWHAATAIALLAWADARRRSTPVPGQCVACGYDVAGLPGPRCPECGADIGEPVGERE